MTRPAKPSDYVSIVETCYKPSERDADWLAELFETAAPVLDLGLGLGLSLVREGPNGTRKIELSYGLGPVSEMLQATSAVIEHVDAPTYRQFYYPQQPVVLASTLVSGFVAPLQQLFAATMARAGAADLLGMLGYPAQGWAFAMFVALKEPRVDRRLRETLRRLRIHVEASLRLRKFGSEHATAILRPDGKIEHLAGEIGPERSVRDLVHQASAIEFARGPRGRADPERALAVWKALVAGRWSLVERRDSDGRRFYHAFENAPHVRELRALTETEARVVDLSLRGLLSKEIAYSTGLSASRISSALSTAAERLGFANSKDMLRTGAQLIQEGEAESAELTPAESAVLSLLREGMSNAQIAALRGTSVNTVANQIASLLRKTGAASRNALIVRAPNLQL